MSTTDTTKKKFFGHPFQLSTLFHIELWERFSFYGLQGILLLYLYYETAKGGLGIDKPLAGGIVGAYSGSIYLATVFGGWIADRIAGAEKTLFVSGIIVMSGHIALALIPGIPGLLCGLLLIALGSGGVKTSASSMVGSLYEDDHLRPLRDAGFSIFYISINIGGFFGPLITGLLQDKIGFHYGFGAAAAGMAFGLWLYSFGRKTLPHTPPPHPLPASQYKYLFGAIALIVGAVVAAVATDYLNVRNFPQVLLVCILIVATGYFSRLLGSTRIDKENKRHIAAYIPLFLAICIFWSIWFQIYTSATVYFAETVDRNILGFTVPVSWKDSVQSMWVVLFSGLMAAMWTKMGTRQPKTPLKFALALIVTGSSYLLFLPFINNGTPMPMIVFALVLLAITLGELLLSPIAMSFSTKIAPSAFKTQMVALNFLAFSLGFTLGGLLFDKFHNPESALIQMVSHIGLGSGGADFYLMLFYIGAAGGLLLLLLTPLLNRLLKGVD
ncbi:Di-/tripeptide transporter [Kingella potus]|uniref:Di-/tripeptide transporter n=1 Tax=Kingella potus TaxID=265175 RepID=A0A377R1E4_9NEIS|nr:oligopeptide:H+ symporter [Kingella potus]STR00578.1 Di-/tripeptide transporter [Kingella potus]